MEVFKHVLACVYLVANTKIVPSSERNEIVTEETVGKFTKLKSFNANNELSMWCQLQHCECKTNWLVNILGLQTSKLIIKT